MIRVERLSKTFWVHRKEPGLVGSLKSLVRREKIAKHAVNEVSFDVNEGEVVGLVGANGAGKTTIVKMLAGIVHPSSGEATVLGYRPWERDNRLRRQLALIMGQKAQLWWDLPAADGFLLLKEIYELPDEHYRKNLARLTKLLGVESELNVQLRRLSLGERMKMELIAALLHSPRVVFLDEPTIGLDLSAQRAIREFILEYRAEHKPAMLVTSHYMEDIERLCERILILRDGELVYDGSLRAVVDSCADRKVISARLKPEAPPVARADAAAIGTVLDLDHSSIRLEVDRADIASAASAVLDRLPVADLAIEDVEIGTIIETLMSRRETDANAPRGDE